MSITQENTTYRLIIDNKEINDLNIVANIKLSDDSSPDRCTIDIYNLSKESVERTINAANVYLYAGYNGSNILLFYGQIYNAQAGFIDQNADSITTIYCSGFRSNINKAVVNKTFKKGNSVSSIVNEAISRIGLPVDGSAPVFGVLKSSETYNISAKKLLDQYAKSYGFKWGVVDGRLKISSNPNTNRAVLLNKETGLLGVPSTKKDGVEFESLLNGLIKPHSVVKIETKNTNVVINDNVNTKRSTIDKNASGFYLINEVEYIIDYDNGISKTKAKGTKIG